MILVDADACPVIRLIEQIAEKYSVPCILFCDTNHVLSSDYSEVKVIGAGMDAVDFALVGACSRGDIVVSHLKGPARRTEEDDRKFAEAFERIVRKSFQL